MNARGPAARESVQASLERLLQSREFSRSHNLRRFVRFTVAQTLEGRQDRIKEYSIAVEGYGKDPSYDPRLDPIIRTDAQRLRRKLAKYYQGEGHEEPIRIVYPKGSYVPAFVPAEEPPLSGTSTSPPQRRPFPRLPVAIFVAAATVGALAFRLAGRSEEESIPRVAILSFDDFSQGKQHQALALATTEALAARLSREPGLDVVSRASPMSLGEELRYMEDASSPLEADYMVEGSFQRSGELCRVTAQLVRAADDTNIWAQQYSFDWSEIVGVQKRIAEEVAAEIGARVSSGRAAAVVPKTRANLDPRAYELFARARYALTEYVNTLMPGYLEQAREDLDRALAIDPDYPDALAQLASYKLTLRFPPRENVPPLAEVRELLSRSLRIDPDHVHSLYMLGQVEILEGRAPEALDLTLRAVEADPGDADAHAMLALRYADLGFYEASLEEIEAATARRTRWVVPYYTRVDNFLRLHRLEEASGALEELRGLRAPGPYVDMFEGMLLHHSGEGDTAILVLEETMRKFEGLADTRPVEVLYGLLSALSGNAAEGRRVLEKYRGTSRFRDELPNLALVAGEPELALELIERTPMARNYRWLATNPHARAYLDRPDFRALLVRLHVEWASMVAFAGDRLPASTPQLPAPEELLSHMEGVDENSSTP